jgi:hypothetical protein
MPHIIINLSRHLFHHVMLKFNYKQQQSYSRFEILILLLIFIFQQSQNINNYKHLQYQKRWSLTILD